NERHPHRPLPKTSAGHHHGFAYPLPGRIAFLRNHVGSFISFARFILEKGPIGGTDRQRKLVSYRDVAWTPGGAAVLCPKRIFSLPSICKTTHAPRRAVKFQGLLQQAVPEDSATILDFGNPGICALH